jgi:HAD superfamily hydrolase (TIGR01509 family)
MSRNVKIILSDLDGVIRYFPEGRDNGIEAKFGLPLGSLSLVAFDNSLLIQAITGVISDEVWRAAIATNLIHQFPEADCKAAVDEWSDFHGHIDRDVLNYLKSLCTNKSLGLLTNATSRLNSDLKNVGIIDEFPYVFNSSVIGVAKPSPEIFKYVCTHLKVDPGQIIFVDDSLKNVEAARETGLNAFHFKGLPDLQSKFNSFHW